MEAGGGKAGAAGCYVEGPRSGRHDPCPTRGGNAAEHHRPHVQRAPHDRRQDSVGTRGRRRLARDGMTQNGARSTERTATTIDEWHTPIPASSTRRATAFLP